MGITTFTEELLLYDLLSFLRCERNHETRHKRWDPITSYFHPINSSVLRIPSCLLTFRALAVERVDLVDTLAVV